MRHLQEQAVPRYFQTNTSVANKNPRVNTTGTPSPPSLPTTPNTTPEFCRFYQKGTSIDYVVNSAGSLARSKVEAIEGTVFASGEAGFSILSFTKDELCLDLINGKGKTIHSVKRTKNAQR